MTNVKAALDQEGAIFSNLRAREKDLERYARTIGELHKIDVASEPTYQRCFNALYGVRRNAEWRASFFQLLEGLKDSTDVSFAAVLREMHRTTGRIEASFSSKMVATIDPTRVIYDSVIRGNLGIPNRRSGTASDRIKRLCHDYNLIQEHLDAEIKTAEFRVLRAKFDQEFSHFHHFADLKVLDFALWQMRPVAESKVRSGTS